MAKSSAAEKESLATQAKINQLTTDYIYRLAKTQGVKLDKKRLRSLVTMEYPGAEIDVQSLAKECQLYSVGSSSFTIHIEARVI